MTTTKISWTHAPGFKGVTWNPTTGCTRVSTGCANCYASTLHNERYKANVRKALALDKDVDVIGALRSVGIPHDMPRFVHDTRVEYGSEEIPFPAQYDTPFAVVKTWNKRLEEPLHWKKPRMVFVNSMSDIWHDDVPDKFLYRLFAVMAVTPSHRYLLLTKRPERMQRFISDPKTYTLIRAEVDDSGIGSSHFGWPLPNVWLGVSVEDQQAANARVPYLLATPAAVRFLSCEPLVGPVDISFYVGCRCPFGKDPYKAPEMHMHGCPVYWASQDIGIDWVIVGGESGPRYRPMQAEWAMALREQCESAYIARPALFEKQWSSRRPEVPYPQEYQPQRHQWPQ